jgi:hypothetical protein
MNHKMKEFLKEYDEDLYETQVEREAIQERVDLAEKVLLTDWDALELEDMLESYTDDGHDDFGHEFIEEEEEPFPETWSEEDKYDDYEEEYNP